MDRISELVAGLRDKSDKAAYKCLQALEAASVTDASVYPYFDVFVGMLDDAKSYIRVRGFVLIAANAKWDVDNKIDEIIDSYLGRVADDKPIIARKCIMALPNIAKYKPDLVDGICRAIRSINPQRYASSMQSLIAQDMRAALEKIKAL